MNFGPIPVTVPEMPLVRTMSLSLRALIAPGLSAIATSTWLEQAILTWSPTAKPESEGERPVSRQVKWPWCLVPTVIEAEVKDVILATAWEPEWLVEAKALAERARAGRRG